MALADEVAEFVRLRVAIGDQPSTEIVDDAAEHFDESDPAEVTALAWSTVADGFAAHLDAQSGWPETTDNDRLTTAFRDLNLAGIVARQNFACCQNCGLSEIGGEVAGEVRPRGYAFYHQQDTAGAAAGDGLYVAYGLFEARPTAEIGQEVADALRHNGLTVDWDGDTGQRIAVRMRWARRRTGRLAAYPAAVSDQTPVEIEALDPWPEPDGPRSGQLPAGRLVSLYLPWLPGETRLRIGLPSGPSLTVHREREALVAGDLRVGRFDGMTLIRRLRGEDVGPVAVPDEPGLLDVRWDAQDEGKAVPMTLSEGLELFRRMPPRDGSWICYVGRGGVVQARWDGNRLWLESPDVRTRSAAGTFVDLPDAERMITVLSAEQRVAVDELDGVQVEHW
jgi:hypothetical protein